MIKSPLKLLTLCFEVEFSYIEVLLGMHQIYKLLSLTSMRYNYKYMNNCLKSAMTIAAEA